MDTINIINYTHDLNNYNILIINIAFKHNYETPHT